MRDLDQLTAEKILLVEEPELLFSRSLTEAKREYKLLARKWHPDSDGSVNAVKVFSHIANLYQCAKQKITSGDWCEPAEKIENLKKGWHVFKLSDGSIKSCRYRSKSTFELGETYVCDNSVAFEIENDFTNLFENGRKRIHLLPYKDDAMLIEMTKYLPLIKTNCNLPSAKVLVVHKTPDQLRLSDVFGSFQTAIEPLASIGWILNGLLNIACYLEWAGLNHNAIALENVYISPLRHSVMLLGGWWYATKNGDQLDYVPDSTFELLPPDIVRSRYSDSRVDLECIKAVGRKLAGNKSTNSYKFLAHVPQSLAEWLTLPAAESARNEYKLFKEVLFESFGPPKFVHMKLDADQLYKE